MKRQNIENFIGVLLTLLIISVASIGAITYKSLGEIVNDLETNTNPNSNLILYKEIMVVISSMENKVESYELTNNHFYLDSYDQSVSKVLLLLDSLNRLNPEDIEMLTLNDSLEHLIDQKTEFLNDLLALSNYDISSNMTDLKAKINNLHILDVPNTLPLSAQTDTIRNDTTSIPQKNHKKAVDKSNEKRGFLKRLFSKKEESDPNKEESILQQNTITIKEQQALNRDSIIQAQASRYQSELTEELERIQAQSKETSQFLRSKKMKLQNAHSEVQNHLMALISFLESRETYKVKINSLKARELAGRTNQQIVVFSLLALLLLLVTTIVTISYIQKNKKYQKLLKDAKQSTEAISKIKERFFANMSHEIRTPMNAISGFTKILMKSDLKSNQREHIKIISTASDHLLKLLNDILDFSKLQADKLLLEKTIFNFKELCGETCLLFKELAMNKGLELKEEYINVPEHVIGDPYRLKQILINLLNNSVKFTESGSISLKITSQDPRTQPSTLSCNIPSKKSKPLPTNAIQSLNDKSRLKIEVIDTGIGIPKVNQHRLFQEFEQSDQSSFSKGTGLGLAITKRLVMLHHGHIQLQSTEGKGTTVSVIMNYELSNTPPKTPAAYTYHNELKGLKVLIADDEPFNIKLLATLLDKHQIQYDIASDGQEALDLLSSNSYDTVLLDLKMPKRSGWEVVQTIKSNSGPNEKTQFIALTATVAKLDKELSKRSGFDYILRKPFDERELFSLIGLSPRPEQIVPKVRDWKNVIDLSSLFRMGDQHFVDDMVTTFIQSAEEGWKTIEAEIKTRNFQKTNDIAHKIVAPARHLKALELVKLLKQIEANSKTNHLISQSLFEETRNELNQVLSALKDYLRTNQIT